MNNFNFLDTDIDKNTVTSWAYYEGALKNAVSSLTSNIEFSNKYGGVEKFAKILNECVNGSNIGFGDLIEGKFWTKKGQLLIWTGCYFGMVKSVVYDLLHQYNEKIRDNRTKAHSFIVGVGEQILVDALNAFIKEYGADKLISLLDQLESQITNE